ncbi:MAG: lipid II:glycine glycyltransferase FemX [Candidatus Baldrarchaeia archaeon]
MTTDFKVKMIESKSDWDALLSCCKNVNLLQTWEYGEAKHRTEGWIPMRIAIFHLEKPVAVVQVLIKKIPVLAGIARINRGPLVIYPNHNSYRGMLLELLNFLYKYWVKNKKMILFIAPNCQNDEVDETDLRKLGYNPIDKEPWSSILIDLSLSEETLRRKLHPTWRRNLLNKAEKAGLKLEIAEDEGFSYLMDKYRQMMIEKNFLGPSIRLLRELRNVTENKSNMKVLFAVRNNVRVSGILVPGYFDTCHYLVGWNSDEGRAICANYFLYWQTILLFKKMGFHWFDLGGINERSTPGITRFKRKTGGREYRLIGEFEAYPNSILSNILKKTVELMRRYRGK